jgi:hypothetical protein
MGNVPVTAEAESGIKSVAKMHGNTCAAYSLAAFEKAHFKLLNPVSATTATTTTAATSAPTLLSPSVLASIERMGITPEGFEKLLDSIDHNDPKIINRVKFPKVIGDNKHTPHKAQVILTTALYPFILDYRVEGHETAGLGYPTNHVICVTAYDPSTGMLTFYDQEAKPQTVYEDIFMQAHRAYYIERPMSGGAKKVYKLKPHVWN